MPNYCDWCKECRYDWNEEREFTECDNCGLQVCSECDSDEWTECHNCDFIVCSECDFDEWTECHNCGSLVCDGCTRLIAENPCYSECFILNNLQYMDIAYQSDKGCLNRLTGPMYNLVREYYVKLSRESACATGS